LFFSTVNAQNWQLKITPTDSISKKAINTIKFKDNFKETNEIQVELDSILNQLEQKGIFTPLIELVCISENTYLYNITIGKVFNEISLFFEDEEIRSFLESNNFSIKNDSITIPIEQTKLFLKSLIAHFEKKGYPFIEVKLLNQKIEHDQLVAFIHIKHPKKRTIDKIVIEGYPSFPISFIRHQTPLKIATIYNQEKINKTTLSIQKLSFVNQLKSPEILFTNDSTTVYLYLTKKKAHQFDGLIGFNNTKNNSKLKLHGYVDIQLNNLFNKGEQLSLYWQNTSQKQTSFHLNTLVPYIFKSPISFEGSFMLHKQDSTFLTNSFDIGLLYQIDRHTIKTSAQTYSSNKLISTSNNLNINDYTKKMLGITYSFQIEKLDRFFPIEFESQLEVYTGLRKTDLETTSQQKVIFHSNYTWEINSRNYLFIQNQSSKITGKHFFGNELFLIGGTNTIRGFNENQLFSSAYSIFNIEYRLMTSVDSYLYSITDYGTSKNPIETTHLNLLGLGLGYVFKVNSGFLNISYSIGKISNASFDFNQSKVHLKWVKNF
jgi:hemolysin activation/secretion protein